MQKLNSPRILLIAALSILILTSLSYAGEIFVIEGKDAIKQFAWAYVNTIRELQIEEPKAIPVFQAEIVEMLENGEIRFTNDGREDITEEIRTMKNTKAQALNKSEAADRLLTLKEKDKKVERETDVIRVSENASSDNNNLGDNKDGGGDGGIIPSRP